MVPARDVGSGGSADDRVAGEVADGVIIHSFTTKNI